MGKLKSGSRLAPLPAPGRVHWFIFAAVCAVAFVLFIDQDLLETSNHTYIFLESLFAGEPLEFYQNVIDRPTSLYYVNMAHYNIVTYVLYAIFQLPWYAVLKLAGLAPASLQLVYCGKLVSLAFLLGCVFLVGRLALQLGFSDKKAGLAALAFGLSTPVFFSAMVMGQYDVVCLFFMLLALLRLLQGKMWPFVFWMGIGITFKFFCLFVFVPLLLLYEKKLRRLALYGLGGLWLLAPSTLLYLGRTGVQGSFFTRMAERLLELRAPFGLSVSLFGLMLVLLCAACWLWRADDAGRRALWVCLAAFCLLFIFINWHPQWLMLVCPFMVLTSLHEKNANFWLALQWAFGVAMLGIITCLYPGTFGDALIDFGVLGHWSGVITHTPAAPYYTNLGLVSQIPLFQDIMLVLFYGVLLLSLVLKLPVGKGSLAARWFGGHMAESAVTAPKLWVTFGGAIGLWFVSTMASWFSRAAALF